jgi:ATP-dependent RNA helicase DDX3X
MTPIQKSTYSFLIDDNDNKDILGCSQTGSGKTLAFLFPIINKMLNNGPPIIDNIINNNDISYPITLILTPTRELAEQIYKESRKLTFKTGINIVKIYGGTEYNKQLNELKYGCDILIATPGRLLDHIRNNKISLKYIKYLIIDEADRLLDMGFEIQLKDIILNTDIPNKHLRQNLMFSATFNIKLNNIVLQFMKEYYYIHTKITNTANENIKQSLIQIDDNYNKSNILHNILQNIKGSIISKIHI